MSGVDDSRFEKVPASAVIHGEGLEGMPLPRFRTFVKTLRGMGIEIDPVDPEAEEDVPIYFENFASQADEQGAPHLAVRTWNALHRATWMGKREGDRDGVFPWNLAIDKNSLSYLALREAADNDVIGTIPGIGESCSKLVRGVVDSIEVPTPEKPAE
jgi:hypothetical protein